MSEMNANQRVIPLPPHTPGPLVVTRHFQPYTPEQRANHASSHRLGHQQRRSIGEVFWTVEGMSVAFKTRKQAVSAARLALTRAAGGEG